MRISRFLAATSIVRCLILLLVCGACAFAFVHGPTSRLLDSAVKIKYLPPAPVVDPAGFRSSWNTGPLPPSNDLFAFRTGTEWNGPELTRADRIDMRRQLSITNKTSDPLNIEIWVYHCTSWLGWDTPELDRQHVVLAGHEAKVLLLAAFEMPTNQTWGIGANVVRQAHGIRAWQLYLGAGWRCYQNGMPLPKVPSFSAFAWPEQLGCWTLANQHDQGDGTFSPFPLPSISEEFTSRSNP